MNMIKKMLFVTLFFFISQTQITYAEEKLPTMEDYNYEETLQVNDGFWLHFNEALDNITNNFSLGSEIGDTVEIEFPKKIPNFEVENTRLNLKLYGQISAKYVLSTTGPYEVKLNDNSVEMNIINGDFKEQIDSNIENVRVKFTRISEPVDNVGSFEYYISGSIDNAMIRDYIDGEWIDRIYPKGHSSFAMSPQLIPKKIIEWKNVKSLPQDRTEAPNEVIIQKDDKGIGIVIPTAPVGSSYPEGTIVAIPGFDPIEIGSNGQGTIPADKMPDVNTPVEGVIVTEPGKEGSSKTSVVIPGKETETPSKITVDKDKEGKGVVTPVKTDGSNYPEGTIVAIPGFDPIEIGSNGQGTIPADKMPDVNTPVEGVIVTEPGKEGSSKTSVVIPGKETETPSKITVDKDKEGKRVVTPVKPDGSSYPEERKDNSNGKRLPRMGEISNNPIFTIIGIVTLMVSVILLTLKRKNDSKKVQ